jgi:hypothetical protein
MPPAKRSNSKQKAVKSANSNSNIALKIINDIAKMAVSGIEIDKITEYANANINDYRKTFTGGNPDAECKIARDTAIKLGKNLSPVINYKHFRQRNNNALRLTDENNTFIDENSDEIMNIDENFNDYPNKIENLVGEGINTFHTQRADDSKKIIKVYFEAAGRGYCGDCWLCGLPVFYYFNHGNVTSCGECEHIGGIIASIISGMLASSILNISWINYGTSHAHCNQQKNQLLSMKFDKTSKKWEVDDDGINKIIEKIIESPLHGKEYDPVFRNNHNNLDYDEMSERITEYTEQWCDQANRVLSTYRVTDYATRITNIILDSYSKLMAKINNEIRKKIGGLSLGNSLKFFNNNVNAQLEDNIFMNKIKINDEKVEKVEKVEEMVQEEDIETEDVTLPIINGFDVDILSEEEAQKELNELLAIPEARQLFENLIVAIDNYFTPFLI